MGGRGRRGRGIGNRAREGKGRGGKGIFDDIMSADCAQEGQKASRGGNRGGGVNAQENGSSGRGNFQLNIAEEAQEAEDWKFKTATEKSSKLMNDVLLRVTSREANAGKEKTGRVSSKAVKRSHNELEVAKQNSAALSHQASWWVSSKVLPV